MSTSRSDSPVTLRVADAPLLLAFVSSGVAALGLELIWVRVLGLAFGSESFGMLGVLAGFFSGLALGSAALHRRVVRSRRPVLIYIAAECVVGLYAMLVPRVMIRLAGSLPGIIDPLVVDNRSLIALSVDIAIAMLALLPATFCMGATTVAMVEAWRRRRTPAENALTVAWLYASNTFGATLGIVASTWWLLPTMGIGSASAVLASFSFLGAAFAWRWERSGTAPEPGQPIPAEEPRIPATAGLTPRALYALLFFTGLAGVGLETAGTHVFAQVLENTIYTFANILSVYLLGTAAGAWIYTFGPMRRLARDRDRCTALLLYALGIASIGAAILLARFPDMMAALILPGAPDRRRTLAQTAAFALIFFPPTLCMGATFSHLLGYFTERGVGYAAAINTAGATVAPFLFGLVLIPYAGYGVAFYTAVAIYLIAFGMIYFRRRAQPSRLGFAAAGIALAVGALTYSSLILIRIPPGYRLLTRRTGIYGVVSVLEVEATNGVLLLVDQSYQMGGSPGGVEKRMGHLPLMMGREPKDVLYLGTGTGITAGAALSDGVTRVTAVDLLPEILDVLPLFGDYNANLSADPRVTLHGSDARRFVVASHESYDTIVADLYHPSRDGTATLYTKEHFLDIRNHLRSGGVFVQWLPLYQMTPGVLRTIVRTFLTVFPDADSMIGNYSARATFALVGYASGAGGRKSGLDLQRAQALLGQPSGSGQVFEGVPDLLGSYMLDAAALQAYAGPGPINTDDNLRIAFDAAPSAHVGERNESHLTLQSLMPYRRAYPDDFIAAGPPEGLDTLRKTAGGYGDAATHYLNAEFILRRPGAAGTLPEEAIMEYLRSYEADVRFESAPRRLLGLGIQNGAPAKDIADRLWSRHPDQPSIRKLHESLEGVYEPEKARGIVAQFLGNGR